MPSISLNVATALRPIKLEASPDAPLFILGRNGTGKSALVQNFASQLAGKAIYLPGSRPSYFDAENLNLTPFTRNRLKQNLMSWDPLPDTRWKSNAGTSRNEKAIHDLTVAELQFKVDAANEIERDGKESGAVSRLQARISPLDRVNALLRQGNLPITVAIDRAELQARGEDGVLYSIAKMSDGERTALVLIAEVVSAAAGSVFLIDEPELHLHRSIVVPLIGSMIRENPASTFIVSTHELELSATCPQASVVIVRSCYWNGGAIGGWEVDIIPRASELPEDLRVDVLGSRRKILFVEGAGVSLDAPLYALLFPKVSVRSRENCREVERAVTGSRALEAMHRAEVFGMVDGDGMSQAQVADFEAKNVYPLPAYAVESLYYDAGVLTAVAERQAGTLGLDKNVLLAEAKTKALEVLASQDVVVHLASMVAERQLRDGLLEHLPGRDDIKNGATADVSVSLTNPYPKELARLQGLRSQGDIGGIISRYPVRESPLLSALARALRFPGRADYERAVLSGLAADETLRNALRAKLGVLSSRLV